MSNLVFHEVNLAHAYGLFQDDAYDNYLEFLYTISKGGINYKIINDDGRKLILHNNSDLREKLVAKNGYYPPDEADAALYKIGKYAGKFLHTYGFKTYYSNWEDGRDLKNYAVYSRTNSDYQFEITYRDESNQSLLYVTIDMLVTGNGATITPYKIQWQATKITAPSSGIPEKFQKYVNAAISSKISTKFPETPTEYLEYSAEGLHDLIEQIGLILTGENEDLEGSAGGPPPYIPDPPPPPKGPILYNIYNKFKFNEDDIEEFKSINDRHAKLLLAEYSRLRPSGSNSSQQIPPFFLPFDISLEVEGISGLILFQKFLITNNVLPPQYEDNFDLVITGVDHKVDNKGWSTNIKTKVTPSDPTSEIKRPKVNKQPPKFRGFID